MEASEYVQGRVDAAIANRVPERIENRRPETRRGVPGFAQEVPSSQPGHAPYTVWRAKDFSASECNCLSTKPYCWHRVLVVRADREENVRQQLDFHDFVARMEARA